MQLTKFSDYALRVVLHLANSNTTLVTTREIASIHRIKYNHLSKVTQALVRLGYLEAIRGRNGGVRLAKDPKHIRLGQMMQELEANTGLVECLSETNSCCAFSGKCGVSDIFKEAEKIFFAYLEGFIVADAIERKPCILQVVERMNSQIESNKIVVDVAKRA